MLERTVDLCLIGYLVLRAPARVKNVVLLGSLSILLIDCFLGVLNSMSSFWSRPIRDRNVSYFEIVSVLY